MVEKEGFREMNKYALGTVFGTALLGLTKRRFGSNLKLTAKKVKCLSFHFWANTKLVEHLHNENIFEEDAEGFTVYPPEYWEKMGDIEKEQVNPKLRKETLIDRDGLKTFIAVNIDMEAFEDGDPTWQSSTVDFCFMFDEENEIDINTEIRDEMINRYGHIHDIIGMYRGSSTPLLEKIFSEFGVFYEYTDNGDGWDTLPWNDSPMVFSLDERGEEIPYTPPRKARTKLRKR